MKKTLYINLNGFAFHIDEDAYDKLNQYLKKIENSFSDKDEAKEIVADIEARIAELFSGKKRSAEEVITLTEVEEVITTMGEPQDIADEEEPQASSSNSSSSSAAAPIYRKRLYRDTDSRYLGGVCGGLGAYFDIDPLVFRIIFLITFILYGASLPVYIVLWIVMPKALTITQKLEMKGPASYEAWEQNIRNEYQEVSEKFKQSQTYQNFSGSFSKGTDAMGNALRTTVRILLSILGVAIMVGTLAALVSLILTFTFGFTFFDFSGLGNYYTSLPGYFLASSDMIIGSIGIILVTCIPILLLFYLGFRLVFRFRSGNRVVGISALVLWLAGLILVVYTTARVAREFSVTEDKYKKEQLTIPQDSIIYLNANTQTHIPEYQEHLFDVNRLDVYLADEKVHIQGRPRIELVRGDEFAMDIKKMARGRSLSNALQNCDNIEFFWMQKDSIISIDPVFTIQENSKIRDQKLTVVITVPEGVKVEVADELEWVVYDNLD